MGIATMSKLDRSNAACSMYLNIQCNKRGTPKNRFTYKTLCRCHMKKKYRKIANEKNGV